jgi:glycosyltransferase involved in cell wall biosynthesis
LEAPFVSIIIPVFNAKAKLKNAMESIVSQTYTDYEIIIVDGLSTDGSIDLVKSYSAQCNNIRYISEADNGIYDAMNKGMELADGKWLYFLGADDTFYQDVTLSTIASNLASTEAKIVYGNVEINGNTSWARNGEIYDGPFTFQKLLNKNICHQSIFYNSDFINNEIGKYDIKYKLCADWDFNLRCFAKTNFLYTSSIIAKFHSGGLSTLSNEDYNFSHDFVSNVLKYFNISPFNPSLNNSDFDRFAEVLSMQKRSNYFKYIWNRLKIKFRQQQFI